LAKLSFGIQTPQQNVDWSELTEFWRFLDRETAFDSLWMMDHLVPPAEESDSGEPCFEAWTCLAAASQVTERLRLGCLVTANTFRHPALLAKMAATLDHASGGRLELALGAGWNEVEHRAYGIPLHTPGTRLDRLEEAAQILRSFMTCEGPVSFEGRHYRLEEAPFAPGFVQQPHPRLVIGGNGERRTLRIAALYADAANLLGPVSVVRDKLEVLRRHCREVGRDEREISKTVHVPAFVHEDRDVVDRVAPFLASHLGVSEEVVRTETPVGSAAHARAVCTAYAELGISELWLPIVAPYSHESVSHLSDSVAGHFA